MIKSVLERYGLNALPLYEKSVVAFDLIEEISKELLSSELEKDLEIDFLWGLGALANHRYEEIVNKFSNNCPNVDAIDQISIELSKKAKEIIGLSNIERFKEFTSYKEDWAAPFCWKPLSVSSVNSFEAFISFIPSKLDTEPSLFLSVDGNLILAWEDKNQNSIEIEFLADRWECLAFALRTDLNDFSTDTEFTIYLNQIKK